eukprot:360580-Chlamydomonas_euryale.AAC.1
MSGVGWAPHPCPRNVRHTHFEIEPAQPDAQLVHVAARCAVLPIPYIRDLDVWPAEHTHRDFANLRAHRCGFAAGVECARARHTSVECVGNACCMRAQEMSTGVGPPLHARAHMKWQITREPTPRWSCQEHLQHHGVGTR